MNPEKLRALKESRGWTYRMFADKVGVEKSYLRRVICGKCKAGGKFYEGMLRLCKRQDLNIYDFMTDENSR